MGGAMQKARRKAGFQVLAACGSLAHAICVVRAAAGLSDQMARMFPALSPLGPVERTKDTRWFSDRLLKPSD